MNPQSFMDRIFEAPAKVISRDEMEKGASSRRYFRINIDSHSNTDQPSSLVQMVLPKDSMKSDEAGGEEQFDELPFVNVQRHMALAGLPVPKIYLDATKEGHVFLEDLGGSTFNTQITGYSENEVEQWYNAAVDLLAQMHESMWPIHKDCFAGRRSFDYELLRWELDHYREWGVEKRFHITLEPQVRARMDELFDNFATEIDSLPKGFVHRDYQSRNLMVRESSAKPSSLCIIDFQDALVGPRTYDLVALLNDSYVDLSFDVQERLIQRYASNRKLPTEEIRSEFDLITVQRKLKDGGRFIFIDQVKNDPSFLPFVKKSFQRVHAALQRLSGHNELKALLKEVDPDCFG